jgi:hypothetical protein
LLAAFGTFSMLVRIWVYGQLLARGGADLTSST